MKNKLRILNVSPDFDDPRLYKIADMYMKNATNQISLAGGVGGLDLEYLSLSENQREIFNSITDIDNLIAIIDELNPHVIIQYEAGQFFKFYPNFMEKFKGLFFGRFDPLFRSNSKRVFDFNFEYLDNRELVAFIASELQIKKIFFIQGYWGDNRAAYDRYKQALQNHGWKGKFQTFSFSEEQEADLKNLLAREGNYENLNTDKEFQKIYLDKVSDLRNNLLSLPEKTLLVYNADFDYAFEKIIWENEVNFPILDLRETFDGIIFGQDILQTGSTIIRTRITSFNDIDFKDKVAVESNKYEKIIGQFSDDVNIAKDEYFSHLFRISHKLYFMQKAANFSSLKFQNTDDAINQLPKAINLVDGNRDIFLREGCEYFFEDNINSSFSSSFIERSCFVNQLNSFEFLLLEKQPLRSGEKASTIYTYLDLQRIERIDVSLGIWVADFELEINSPFSNPIKNLKFSNRSEIDSTWVVNLIRELKAGDRYQSKYRIVGTFEFKPDIREFPYDVQRLSIDMSLEKNIENCVLQPPVSALIDMDFETNGWELVDANSGTISTKNFDRIGTNLKTKVNLEKINRTEWTLARKNNVSVLRSLIPLLVLILLSWYSSFNSAEKAFSTIQLNTTVFLAGVALYFSADKPSGANFTFIDRMFIYFYLAIGTLILTEFSVIVSSKLYEYTHTAWQITIPILLTVLLYNYWKKSTAIAKYKRTN